MAASKPNKSSKERKKPSLKEKGPRPGEEQEPSLGKKITLAGLSTLQKIVVGVVVALIVGAIVGLQVIPKSHNELVEEEPPILPRPSTALQAKDDAVPDVKGPVREEVWAGEAQTFSEPFKLEGGGPNVPRNEYVMVSCKLYWLHPESVDKDGYWYRIATKPWEGLFSPANSYWNGDKPGHPLTHSTDFHVRDCREGELPDG